MLLEKKRTVYLKELSTAFNRSEEKRKSEAAKTQAEESVNPQKKKTQRASFTRCTRTLVMIWKKKQMLL